MTEQEFQSLFDAIRAGDLPAVREFFDSHPEHTGRRFLRDCLRCAARAGHMAIGQYLVELGGEFDGCLDALHATIRGGHLQFARFLHEHGVQLSTRVVQENPLFTAILAGGADVVEWLLTTNIDPDLVYETISGDLINAFSFARDHRQAAIGKLLKKAGCRLPRTRFRKDTPVKERKFLRSDIRKLVPTDFDRCHDAICDRDAATALGLIDQHAKWKADPNSVRRLTASAARTGQLSIMQSLQDELHADPKLMGDCLHDAADQGHLSVAEYLVQLGVDVDYQNPTLVRYGAICKAVGAGHLELAKFLHAHGASLLTGLIEENALIGAISEDRAELVQWLLGTEIDRHVVYRGTNGALKNALSYADDRGRERIVKLLEAAGCRRPVEGVDSPVKDYSAKPDDSQSDQQGNDAKNKAIIIEHMSSIFGGVNELSMQEIFPVMPGGPAVNVHVIPADQRDSAVIFTTGMSDRAMVVPDGQEDFQYAELMMQLPADWPMPVELNSTNKAAQWPFQWLRQLAYYPHQNETWLRGEYTVISTDDPPQSLGPNTGQTCFLLVTKVDLICKVALPDKICNLYRVLPLYTEERDLFLSEGIGPLWERLQAHEVDFVLNVDRVNVAVE